MKKSGRAEARPPLKRELSLTYLRLPPPRPVLWLGDHMRCWRMPRLWSLLWPLFLSLLLGMSRPFHAYLAHRGPSQWQKRMGAKHGRTFAVAQARIVCSG